MFLPRSVCTDASFFLSPGMEGIKYSLPAYHLLLMKKPGKFSNEGVSLMSILKEKTSKFGSTVGLLVVTALIVSFSLALPEFFLSTTGRIFAVLWAIVAGGVFLAHTRRILLRRPVRALLPAVATKRATFQKGKHPLRG
jgi:hypothetical protein